MAQAAKPGVCNVPATVATTYPDAHIAVEANGQPSSIPDAIADSTRAELAGVEGSSILKNKDIWSWQVNSVADYHNSRAGTRHLPPRQDKYCKA